MKYFEDFLFFVNDFIEVKVRNDYGLGIGKLGEIYLGICMVIFWNVFVGLRLLWKKSRNRLIKKEIFINRINKVIFVFYWRLKYC